MRRSLRKIDTQEVTNYKEDEQLFTVLSLDEARQRLSQQGLDPASYCFFTWMREGIRYYRVWEDKKLKAGIIRPAGFGHIAARLKRADAEKLYTVARRHKAAQTELEFAVTDGTLEIRDRSLGQVVASVSVPLVGGDLIMNDIVSGWRPNQVSHFLNVVLMRGQPPDRAFLEASQLQG